MAAHFAIIPADEAPDPGRPWVLCLTCNEPVEDYPPARSGHRRRHQAKPLQRRSPMLTVAQRAIRHQVFERDGFRCGLRDVAGVGSCHGPLTPHHRRKASQGGKYTLDNLATLCRHHNDLLESRADVAAIGECLGLVLRRTAHTCGGCPGCFEDAIADAVADDEAASAALSHPAGRMDVAS